MLHFLNLSLSTMYIIEVVHFYGMHYKLKQRKWCVPLVDTALLKILKGFIFCIGLLTGSFRRIEIKLAGTFNNHFRKRDRSGHI